MNVAIMGQHICRFSHPSRGREPRVCEQEVSGSTACLEVRNRKWRLICADTHLRRPAYRRLRTRGGGARSQLSQGPQAPSSELGTG